MLEEGLFVITEELSHSERSVRSMDLLCLDASGRLVVVELKHGDTGEQMDLQAIRYAAVVSTITLEQAIEAHQVYLVRQGIREGAEERIQQHLEYSGIEGISFGNPRIILVSEEFSSELATCALWLNERELDVTCIRLQAYRIGSELFVDTRKIIPLPKAQDYLVKVRVLEEQTSRKSAVSLSSVSFKESIDSAPEEFREGMKRVVKWAEALNREGLAVLENSGRYIPIYKFALTRRERSW